MSDKTKDEINIETLVHKILPYNRDFADGEDFSIFKNSMIFCTNIKFAGNNLQKGTVFVIYYRNELIGEFTVEKYIYIDRRLETDYEKLLYKLISYPISIMENPIPDEKDDWIRGHIIYSNCRVYKIPFDFTILNKNIAWGNAINITYEELLIIREGR